MEASAKTSAGTPEMDYAGKCSVIHRSMRCLVYGVMGAVPFLGAPTGAQAVALHRAVALETGERWRPWRMLWPWYLQIIVVMVLAERRVNVSRVFMLGFGVAFILYLGVRYFRQYRGTQPRLWNPARLWLYWGLWLAQSGEVISVQFGLMLFCSAMRFFQGR